MCGIIGQVVEGRASAEGARPSVDAGLRALAHRGPDGHAIRVDGGVCLGHARLAVRDPREPSAAQPMATPDGAHVLAFNGELYDDAAWRMELEDEVRAATGGRGFRTRCDAETLLWALTLRGVSALDRVRGMYALAFLETRAGRLWLARDPLGVKPLYMREGSAPGGAGLQFASETRALCALLGGAPELDPEGLATYLSTSRRVAFGRTLFQGIRSLEPGEVVQVDLNGSTPRAITVATGDRFRAAALDAEPAAEACRAVIEGSVRAHLVSDVPVCSLLSGGLDSAIVARTAAAEVSDLRTWCASAPVPNPEETDAGHAELVARNLGVRHRLATVDREAFLEGWRAHVEHLGQPLSTPNEVAIVTLAREIRGSGAVVALSGEGADELFGGYDAALAAFDRREDAPTDGLSPGRFHLEATAWLPPAVQRELLIPALRDAHAWVVESYERAHDAERTLAGTLASPLEAHLRLQRRVNLTALLERLDAATMRHSVEGRTPFADLAVARFADGLPMASKFRPGPAPESKRILRRAFEGLLPDAVVRRPKASFPLPFEAWSAPLATSEIARSEFLGDVVVPEVLALVRAAPEQNWRLTWLLGNLALFADAAWGASAPRPVAA